MGNLTGIGYLGKVTLTYKNGDKEYKSILKNEGFSPLFETLATLLARGGYPYGPISFVSMYCENTGKKENLLNSSAVPLITSPSPSKTANGNWCCLVSAAIRPSDINTTAQSNIGTGDKVWLYLHPQSSSVVLARVQLDTSSVQNIGGGTSLFIEWDLFFDNRPQPSEDNNS